MKEPKLRVFFLVFIISFATSLVSFGYTVVLQATGKQIKGDVIFEDEHQIHLRDETGITLVLKKTKLDLKQMEVINNKLPQKPPPVQTQPSNTNSSKHKPTLSDAKAKKTGKARVLKLEDLEKLPELSVIGSEESAEEEAPSEQTQPKEKETEQPSAADEQYWRDRMKQLRIQAEDLKKKAAEADIECERTGGRSSSEKAGSTYLPNTNCKNADDFLAQSDAAEEEMRKLRLEGTVRNLPPEWFQE